MGIAQCCWKRWWTRSAFEEPATEPPTGSISGRPPDVVAWTGSTKTTAEPSKTSTSIRWFVMPANGYALIRPGKQIRNHGARSGVLSLGKRQRYGGNRNRGELPPRRGVR